MKWEVTFPAFVQFLVIFSCGNTVDTSKQQRQKVHHEQSVTELNVYNVLSSRISLEVNDTAGKKSGFAYSFSPKSVHSSRQKSTKAGFLANRHQIAVKNLRIGVPYSKTHKDNQEQGVHSQEGNIGDFLPGEKVQPFSISTLDGSLYYPGSVINYSTPVLVHAYNPHSGFARCLWNCTDSFEELFLLSPDNAHYIFISHDDNAASNAIWMKTRAKETAQRLLALKR